MLQTSSSGKEEERKEALITITKSKDIKDLEQDFKNYLNNSGAWGSSSKASQGLQKISSLETMARTIQGAQHTTAASKDHALLGPTPTFHLTKPLWRWELLFREAQSSPGTAPRAQLFQEETRTSHRETGQGGPSWSHSSPLHSGGGTSEAILFSSPNDFLLSYSLLTLFQSSPLPYLLLFEPRSCNPQSPFFLFLFSCPFKEKSTYWDCKRLWLQAIKALFYCGQDPSVSPISYAGGCTCLTKPVPVNADLP